PLHSWSVQSGQEIAPPRRAHRAWISQMLFTADGRTLLTASADQTIERWNTSNPSNVTRHARPLRGHTLEVWRIKLLKDSRTLLSGSKDGSVLIWDLQASRDAQFQIVLPEPIDESWAF